MVADKMAHGQNGTIEMVQVKSSINQSRSH